MLEPPYTQDTNIAGGVLCYICQKANFTNWANLMQHVKRHGVTQGDLAGTHFHTMAKQEFAAAERERHRRKQRQLQAFWEYDHEEGEEPQGEEGAGHWHSDRDDVEDD